MFEVPRKFQLEELLYKLAKKCDTCNSNRSKKDLSYFNRTNLEKELYRAVERIRNLVSEVHKKVANNICTNYDTILLPKFESQRMVKKNDGDRKRIIKANTARMLLVWRHYDFEVFGVQSHHDWQ